ncbi:MAG: hypothetical protein IH588_10145 [Anaerolineales bacterium]|nr:hypothetical protein [Anaerolineales bacterium]
MPKRLSIKVNFAWMLAGNGCWALCQWIVLSAMTKTASVETVGIFGLAVAVCAPVFTLGNLGLRNVQATDTRASYPFQTYLILRTITTATALVLLFAGTLFFATEQETMIAILFVALARSFESMSDITFGRLQQQERMDWIGQSLVLRGVAQAAVFLTATIQTGTIAMGLAGMAAVSLIMFIAFDLRRTMRISQDHHKEHTETKTDNHRVLQLCYLSLPLGVVALLDSLTATIPRYFLASRETKEELGYYTALAYLLLAGHTLVGALADSVRPRLASLYRTNRPAFRTMLIRLIAATITAGAVALVASHTHGEVALRVLYADSFSSQAYLLPWIIAAGITWYASGFLYTALTARHIFRAQAPVLAVSTVATLIFGCILIPSNGALGATWSLLAGMAVRLTGYVYVYNTSSSEAL